MKLVATAFVSTLGCAAANAAVYEYSYETELVECRTSSFCVDWSPMTRSGSLVIDEERLPGGSLAGVTLGFFQELEDVWMDGYGDWSGYYRETLFQSYEIAGSHGTYSGIWEEDVAGYWAGAPFLKSFGWLSEEFLGWTVYKSELILSFDHERNIVSWYGDNYNSDDGQDPGISDVGYAGFYDHDDGFYSRDQGSWTRTRLDVAPPPSPVPVPAAGAVLAGALAGLGLAAKRRRARPHLG